MSATATAASSSVDVALAKTEEVYLKSLCEINKQKKTAENELKLLQIISNLQKDPEPRCYLISNGLLDLAKSRAGSLWSDHKLRVLESEFTYRWTTVLKNGSELPLLAEKSNWCSMESMIYLWDRLYYKNIPVTGFSSSFDGVNHWYFTNPRYAKQMEVHRSYNSKTGETVVFMQTNAVGIIVANDAWHKYKTTTWTTEKPITTHPVAIVTRIS